MAKMDAAANKEDGMNVNSSDDQEFVIDIENQLIFFTGSKQLKKMKVYRTEMIKQDSAGCIESRVIDKAAGHIVTFCPHIPKNIFPTILFGDSNMGVKTINTPRLTARLSYFAEKKGGDKRLADFAKYFKQYPVIGIEEGFLED